MGSLYIYTSGSPLDALSSIEYVDGDLAITADVGPFDLSSLQGVHEVTGSLYFDGAGDLTSMAGLDGLEVVGEAVWIRHQGLTSLAGLDSLKSAKSIFVGVPDVWTMKSLTSLGGVNSLSEVQWDAVVYGTSISDMGGLEGLKSVGGTLSITHNKDLPTCVAADFSEQIMASEVIVAENLADRCGE